MPYKLVDCYKNDILEQLEGCNVLLWQMYQSSPKDVLMAKELVYALDHAGIKVFPNFKTIWHFDDKIGQKYLFESIKAPLVKSYVFYDKDDAKIWAMNSDFPKVFKLRSGASSANVRLIRNRAQAIRLINKAFHNGFRQYNPWEGLRERWRLYKLGHHDIIEVIEGVVRFFIKTKFERITGPEKGYVYFQDFIDGCSFDIRVKVIDNKCWAFKRMVRQNDFRASGSHSLDFSKDGIPKVVIEQSFELSNKLGLQCIAFDFLISGDNTPYLVEMSYGFGYDEGENYGYWDSELNWHGEEFDPFGWMIESALRS